MPLKAYKAVVAAGLNQLLTACVGVHRQTVIQRFVALLHHQPVALRRDLRRGQLGQTVNIAARVQGQATERAINATGPVVRSAAVMELLDKAGLTPAEKSVELRGIADKVVIYEIP